MFYIYFFFLIQGLWSDEYKKVHKITEEIEKKTHYVKLKLVNPKMPKQTIEILEYGADYVIIKCSKFLGLKHAFYKAIEFFNSKYSKFLIKLGSEYPEQNGYIIVKFIVYNWEV